MNRHLVNRVENLEAMRRRATVFYWEGQSREAALAGHLANHPENQGSDFEFFQVRWLRSYEENRA